jgi:hypothetical protein
MMNITFSNRQWLLAIPIFFLFSCDPTSNDKSFTYSSFAALDSFEVVMPDEYLQTTYWTTYKKDNKNILVEYGTYSQGDLVIHQVDFEEEAYVNTITIPREGPDGFNAGGASVIMRNEDSLYVFPGGRNSFFLYNRDGKKIGEYPYNSPTFVRYYLKPFYSSAMVSGDTMILTTVNNTRYDDPDFFSRVFPMHFFDLGSQSFIDKIGFPDYIKGKFLPVDLTLPMIAPMDDKNFLLNYSFSDSIYIYNIQTKGSTSLYCGADYFGQPKLLDAVPNREEELVYKIMEVDYQMALYHNSKIYLTVTHVTPGDYLSLSPMEVIQKNRRLVSLVELDPNTGELKYYEMPIAKYFVFQGNYLFVGGISDREEGDETYTRFYRYTLE